MTETEKLKASTEEQLLKQRVRDIMKYLKEINEEIEKRMRVEKFSSRVFNIFGVSAILLFLITVFVEGTLWVVLREVAFIFAIVFCVITTATIGMVKEKIGEGTGVINTLHKLGIVEEDISSFTQKKRRRKKIEELIAKSWREEKKKKQEAVYKPA